MAEYDRASERPSGHEASGRRRDIYRQPGGHALRGGHQESSQQRLEQTDLPELQRTKKASEYSQELHSEVRLDANWSICV